MTEFQSSDEKLHPAGVHKYWNESFYLNFFDAEGNWGGASRIAFSANQGYADGFICLYFPDGATGFIRTWECCPGPTDSSRAGAIEHMCLKSFQEWRLRYKGPVYYFENPADMGDFARITLVNLPKREIELDLVFKAAHKIFDFHDSMKLRLISGGEFLKKLRPSYLLNHLGPALRKIKLLKVMSGANHYEHAGKIEGVIRVDGEVHDFKGYGQRDHSWGVRDMRAPTNWRWFSCQFADELCFNATAVEILGLRVSGGYVYNGGLAEALDDWTLEAKFQQGQKWATNIALSLRTCSGKLFAIRGDALANIPVIVNTGGYATVVNEARCRYSYKNSTAYGISEFMEQLL
ncbi:MAG: hypothetical protein GY866_28025 [Proteobacteria bacterium]|nr:hypothetical protein [Pseudomonadota bacterium]